MGSRSKVKAQVGRIKSSVTVEQKLDAVADALYEIADFIDDLENQLRNLENKIGRH